MAFAFADTRHTGLGQGTVQTSSLYLPQAIRNLVRTTIDISGASLAEKVFPIPAIYARPMGTTGVMRRPRVTLQHLPERASKRTLLNS
jgi:hypothetical protein